jgi:hypothetical protein
MPVSDSNTVITEAVKQTGAQGVPGSYVFVGISVMGSAFAALWFYLRNMTNRLMAAHRERINFQEKQLVAVQEERDRQSERRIVEAKDNVSIIVAAINESTNAIKTAATSNAEIFEAIRALDQDIRQLQQRVEDCRREISRGGH